MAMAIRCDLKKAGPEKGRRVTHPGRIGTAMPLPLPCMEEKSEHVVRRTGAYLYSGTCMYG
jgi:hypothetical protein